MWRAGVGPSGPTHNAACLVVEPWPLSSSLSGTPGAELRFTVVECGDDRV
jgi:hypothetical protein